MKKNLLIIFGGQSSEHEISIKSAINIIDLINEDKYNLILIGITRLGEWKLIKNKADIKNGKWMESCIHAYLNPSSYDKNIHIIDNGKYTTKNIDVIFPILHGLNGEDGSIQGLFELAKIPYVGCGIFASSCAMDKLFTKIIVDSLGIRQAKYVAVNKKDILNSIDDILDKVESKLSFPMFVKPSNAGSSIGVSKVHNRAELKEAFDKAFCHDRKLLVEEFISAREIECAILAQDGNIKASTLGEIKAASDFYDFDAKYNNPKSYTIVKPDLDEAVTSKIQEYAIKIFKALDGYSLSRVDFFVNDNNEIIFNEINTMPGFTAISMYPILCEADGISKYSLVDILIEQALRRFE